MEGKVSEADNDTERRGGCDGGHIFHETKYGAFYVVD